MICCWNHTLDRRAGQSAKPICKEGRARLFGRRVKETTMYRSLVDLVLKGLNGRMVGARGFEPPTTRPPQAVRYQAALRPDWFCEMPIVLRSRKPQVVWDLLAGLTTDALVYQRLHRDCVGRCQGMCFTVHPDLRSGLNIPVGLDVRSPHRQHHFAVVLVLLAGAQAAEVSRQTARKSMHHNEYLDMCMPKHRLITKL